MGNKLQKIKFSLIFSLTYLIILEFIIIYVDSPMGGMSNILTLTYFHCSVPNSFMKGETVYKQMLTFTKFIASQEYKIPVYVFKFVFGNIS